MGQHTIRRFPILHSQFPVLHFPRSDRPAQTQNNEFTAERSTTGGQPSTQSPIQIQANEVNVTEIPGRPIQPSRPSPQQVFPQTVMRRDRGPDEDEGSVIVNPENVDGYDIPTMAGSPKMAEEREGLRGRDGWPRPAVRPC